MAERMIGLSIDKLFAGNHNSPLISAFIVNFSETLYSGDGRRPQFLSDFKIDIDFPVKLLVGLPKKLLTREQRLLAEAYTSHFFSMPLGKGMDEIWTSRPAWNPSNPSQITAPAPESKLDVDWMRTIGINNAVGDLILLSPSAMHRAHLKQNTSTTLRYVLALSVYGFPDPYQFLTSSAKLKR